MQGEGDHPPLQRSGKGQGLNKRSAEAWGDSLRARGAELPLAAFRAGRGGAGTGPAEVEAENAKRSQRGGGFLRYQTTVGQLWFLFSTGVHAVQTNPDEYRAIRSVNYTIGVVFGVDRIARRRLLMTDKALDDLDAVRTIVETLKNFKPEEQQRILRWAVEKAGLPSSIALASTTAPGAPASPGAPVVPSSHAPVTTPSTNGAVDIKSFIDQKQPRSDVQFAATVAYYLRFEAPPAERKESIGGDDLQEACRKAKRDRLKNPYQTLKNAHTLGLLDKGSEKATFALNTVGENLVAMTLPGDGKAAPKPGKPRKAEKAKKAAKKVPAKKAPAKKASKAVRKA